MRLNLGCGNWKLPGYVNIDLYSDDPEVVKMDVKKLDYPDNSVEEIYASHLIEHFHFFEAFEVLKEWKRVLIDGGRLVLETPDFLASCKAFVEADEKGRIDMYSHFFSEAWVNPGQIHKFLYTETQMFWTLQQVGFKAYWREPALRYTGREHICMKVVAIK